MNHRYFSRKPVNLQIKLSSRQRDLGVFRVRDINQDGIGVEGDFSACDMSPVVQIEFVDPGLQGHHDLKGLVVFHSDNSIGLLFSQSNHQLIQSVLQYSDSKAAA